MKTSFDIILFLMKVLDLKNPFGAPVCHEESVSSTMDIARVLAGQGKGHGTVISADFQEAGRGRLQRRWATERGKNLLFTILLRYGSIPSIPAALTLRTGLALSFAIEDLAPALCGSVLVKWPNDIMIHCGGDSMAAGARKAAGILTETDCENVFIGVGVNVAQMEFPAELGSKAISLIQAAGDNGIDLRFVLLEKILFRLHEEIEKPQNPGLWQERLLSRLYKKGETVSFAEGTADSKKITTGILSGIGSGGELLIIPHGSTKERSFINGELRV